MAAEDSNMKHIVLERRCLERQQSSEISFKNTREHLDSCREEMKVLESRLKKHGNTAIKMRPQLTP